MDMVKTLVGFARFFVPGTLVRTWGTRPDTTNYLGTTSRPGTIRRPVPIGFSGDSGDVVRSLFVLQWSVGVV
jgi:hypothetical protein